MSEERIEQHVITKSLLWKILERSSTQIINFTIQIFLARLISPEHFGELAIITAIINYASIFVQSGMSTAIIQKENLKYEDISTVTVISLLVALAMYILLYILSPFIANAYHMSILGPALRVLGVVLFLHAINSVQIGILTRKMQFNKIFYRSVISLPISGFIGIFLAYKGYGIWSLIAFNILNILITCVVMMFGLKIKFSLKISLKSAKEIYSFGIKIMLTSMITGAHDMLRTVFIGKVYSSNDLAFHDKGMTYSSYITQIITSSVPNVMLPVFSRSQNNISEIKNIMSKTMKMMSFFIFPILFGFAAISKEFVFIFLTEAWKGAIPFLITYCILRLPGCLTCIDKQIYLALGKSQICLKYEFIICFLNITLLLLNLFVFPFSNGAIYITIGAAVVEYIGFFILSYITKMEIDYSLLDRMNDILKPFISSLLMYISLLLIKNLNINIFMQLIVKILFGAIIYITLEIILKDKILYNFINNFKKNHNNL